MRYLVTLKPLEPFLFGGENTFGGLGDKEHGTYLVTSRLFPQQSAILGMLKKEIMIQSGVLTRKVRGEWIDKHLSQKAAELVGSQKFDIFSHMKQDFGSIKGISPIFLLQDGKKVIKRVNVETYKPEKIAEHYKLTNYSSKEDIFDNYVDASTNKSFKTEEIFSFKSQTLNQKESSESSLYKKTSCILKDGYSFGFFLESDYELKDSFVSLGADRSSFRMLLTKTQDTLEFKSEYLTLLSDSYITVPLKQNCDFAITSEISYQSLQNKKGVQKNKRTDKNSFAKSQKVYMYEKGSVIIKPSQALLDNLNNKNLQQIGYNIFTFQGEIF